MENHSISLGMPLLEDARKKGLLKWVAHSLKLPFNA
jgi:hypothetical protein